MAQITLTLNLPDDLADRLQTLTPDPASHLIALLQQTLTPATVPRDRFTLSPIHTELCQFLLSQPTPSEILDYQISETAQDRLQELLDQNRERGLTAEEKQELDFYEELEHFMFFLKIQAYDRLSTQSSNA